MYGFDLFGGVLMEYIVNIFVNRIELGNFFKRVIELGKKKCGEFGIFIFLIFFVKLLNKRFDLVVLLENKVFIKKLYIEYFYKFLWKYNVLLL